MGGSVAADAPATSRDIQNEEEARAYWRNKIAGVRQIACEWRGIRYKLTIDFSPRNEHAFTGHLLNERGQDVGLRGFSLERARLMDGIAFALSKPSDIRRHGESDDLFIVIGTVVGAYKVALEWKQAEGRYRFKSAYSLPARQWSAEARALREGAPRSVDAPMRKAVGASLSTQTRLPACGPTRVAPLAVSNPFAGITVGWTDATVAAASAFFKALGAGERWITVRPNGPGTEGQPVLIKPAGDGAYSVIGGAGGKLNYLKLTGVRPGGTAAGRTAV